MPDYKVQLDTYSGPMDLLLYLIRREEVDIYDIPITHLLEQYLEYVRVLEMLDPDVVGEFLVLAATLMEIKSRMLLPKPPPEESDEDWLDPRADLVRQLLAYKAYREAADYLGDRKELQSRRFARPPVDIPAGEEEVDIEDAQIWDLLNAFNKLLASVGQQTTTHDVVYDDTPVTLHAADVLDRLEREGPVMNFELIFEGRTRSEMIGLFLALLELIRQCRVRVEQSDSLGSIDIHLLDPTPISGLSDTMADEWAPEEDEFSDAPFEEQDAPLSEAVEDVWDDQEDDEYSRRIGEVQVGEVDLGRTPDGPELLDTGDKTAELDNGSAETGGDDVENTS